MSTRSFITSTGTAPAMIPVRNEDRSNVAVVEPELAMNIVGTPYRLAPFRGDHQWRGSKPGAGNTIAAPCVVQARLPSTMPKQW